MIRRPEAFRIVDSQVPHQESLARGEQLLRLVLQPKTVLRVVHATNLQIVDSLREMRAHHDFEVDLTPVRQAYDRLQTIEAHMALSLKEHTAFWMDTEKYASGVGVDLSAEDIDFLNGYFIGRFHIAMMWVDKRNNAEAIKVLLQDLNSAWVRAGGEPRRGYEKFAV